MLQCIVGRAPTVNRQTPVKHYLPHPSECGGNEKEALASVSTAMSSSKSPVHWWKVTPKATSLSDGRGDKNFLFSLSLNEP